MGFSGRMCKKIRIRHEESSKRLADQLALICKGKSGLQPNQTATQDELTPQRPVIRRGSLSNLFKIKVDACDIKIEELCVAISENTMDICKLRQTVSESIKSVTLNTDVDAASIMCYLDSGTLDIKQYPTQYLKLQYSNSTRYVPIMHQDDATGTWQMVLHIPGCYDSVSNTLQVKTVDEKLIVSWCDNRDMDRACNVTMDLPYNVVSRSVTGMVSEDNQLIVQASLGTRNRLLTIRFQVQNSLQVPQPCHKLIYLINTLMVQWSRASQRHEMFCRDPEVEGSMPVRLNSWRVWSCLSQTNVHHLCIIQGQNPIWLHTLTDTKLASMQGRN